MIQRRSFLAKAGGALATTTLATALDAPSVIAQPKFQWRMSTAWPPALKLMHGSAVRLAKTVEELSGGRLRIEVFAGDQIVPAFGAFEAASKGTIEAFMGAPSYWADNEPAIEWFQTVPFGMNPDGMEAWYHQGDGLKLWQETYAPFNLVPRQGSGRRSIPPRTTRASGCASAPVSATRWSRRRAALPCSFLPPGSLPRSSAG